MQPGHEHTDRQLLRDDPFYNTASWPNESTLSGLQFIRGYPTTGNGDLAPVLRTAYFSSNTCSTGTDYYFNAHPTNACTASLTATLNIGSENFPVGPPAGPQVRTGSNVEVRYRIVSDTGNTCAFNTATCSLNGAAGPGDTTYITSNTIPTFAANSGRNAIALRVRYKSPIHVGATTCNASGNNCQFYITGTGTSARGAAAPSDAAILAAPVQRMFRGNSLMSTNVQWLRLSTYAGCGATPSSYPQAASVPNGAGNHCFFMDMGLKGGIAVDAGEQPILFNDGIGSSQMGSVDCDPTIPQGKELTIGVVNGCNVWYARHPFDYNPLCPSANNLFSGYPTGNPGSPWNDGRWPPIRCIKTRPTGSDEPAGEGSQGASLRQPERKLVPADLDRLRQGS